MRDCLSRLVRMGAAARVWRVRAAASGVRGAGRQVMVTAGLVEKTPDTVPVEPTVPHAALPENDTLWLVKVARWVVLLKEAVMVAGALGAAVTTQPANALVENVAPAVE